MSIAELHKAYDELDPAEQVLFATLIAADQMVKTDDFKKTLDQRHASIESGRKWSHEDVLALHDELAKRHL